MNDNITITLPRNVARDIWDRIGMIMWLDENDSETYDEDGSFTSLWLAIDDVLVGE